MLVSLRVGRKLCTRRKLDSNQNFKEGLGTILLALVASHIWTFESLTNTTNMLPDHFLTGYASRAAS